MMRREVFMAAAGAMLGAGAGSSLSVVGIGRDAADTPILVLYRRYVALTDQAAAHVCASSDEEAELDRIFYQERDQIEDAMMAMPSSCAADFAAKVMVDTCEGSIFSDTERGALWVEARQLIAGRA